MLLNFKVENWMSYRDEAIMSLVAYDEPRLRREIPYSKAHDMEILPICAIYGGNAAGKTNLFRAFEFLKRYITMGIPGKHIIPVDQFLLDEQMLNGITSFFISVLIDETIYNYSFQITRDKVLSEKLEIEQNGKTTPIYQRDSSEEVLFFGDLDKSEVKHAARHTGDRNLILSNQALKEVEYLANLHRWFQESLVMLSPRNKFNFTGSIINDGKKFNESLATLLALIGTNIKNVGIGDVDFRKLDIPSEIKADIIEKFKLESKQQSLLSFDNTLYTLTPANGNIVAKEMFTEHMGFNGKPVKFSIDQESEGTRRFMDIVPLLLALTEKNSTLVAFVDEMDSSMHTILTKAIIRFFLSSTKKHTRSQLLLTTHDTNLIDKKLLREDELLLIEQNSLGVSSIMSAVDFEDSLSDSNLKESYLEGRLGGISDVYPILPSQVHEQRKEA